MNGKEWTQSMCTLDNVGRTLTCTAPLLPRPSMGRVTRFACLAEAMPPANIVEKKKQTTNKYPWLILHSITVQKIKHINIHWCMNKEDTHPTTATPTWHGLCSFVWLWGQNSTSCAATRSPTIAPPVAPPWCTWTYNRKKKTLVLMYTRRCIGT